MRELNEKSSSHTQEKITEKMFTQSLAVSIFGILLCMAALCSATWAWFNAGVSSDGNSIQSTYCDVLISVANDGAEVEPIGGRYFLNKDTVYEVKLTASGTAKTAYCILNINGSAYYTEQISTKSEHDPLTFKLCFTSDTQVEIIKRWGTSSKVTREIRDGLYYVDLAENDTPDASEATE